MPPSRIRRIPECEHTTADIKRAQLVAVRDPGRALVEETSVDPDHIKKLAEKYLSGKNPAPPARVEGG